MASPQDLETEIRATLKQIQKEDLPNRVTRLEAQMSEVREDVQEARRDIAEIKAKFESVATKNDLEKMQQNIAEAILVRDKEARSERQTYIGIMRFVIYALLAIVGTIALGVAGSEAGARIWRTLFGG